MCCLFRFDSGRLRHLSPVQYCSFHSHLNRFQIRQEVTHSFILIHGILLRTCIWLILLYIVVSFWQVERSCSIVQYYASCNDVSSFFRGDSQLA